MVQEFLLLDEIIKNSHSLPQEGKKSASVEIQNLTCYWDKVGRLVHVETIHTIKPVQQFL